MEALYENHNFISVCEFLPNHLYFVTVQNINNGGSCEAIIPHTEDMHYFNTDNELVYHNFYGDFGPLGITCLYKFCKKLTNKLATYAGEPFYDKLKNARFGKKEIAEKLQEKFVKNKVVVYYTSTNNEKRANAAFLIAAFAVLYLGYSPRTAFKALQPNKLRFRAFQDASIGFSPYKISMKDCLDALHKASVFGFFNFNDFNAAECSYYENIEHGDLNWVIPQKFIALPGPVEEKNDYYHHPNFYIEYFLNNNVTDVVRLNQRAYDPKCFSMFNIKHHDLYMQDGTDPPDSILKSFMHIAESASGAIAVHCKAGLGRTGSLIGAYLLKHYRMTAKEAIAWIRICRPGSVIGHQQTWLENHEESLWYEGNEWRFKMYGKTEIVPFLQYGIYSFDSPKKEFPGLRELLTNLTKRARYRFIAKNRTKKSKTRLQQVIKKLLESGKTMKNEKSTAKTDQPLAVEQNSSFVLQSSQSSNIRLKPSDNWKNIQIIKTSPKVEEDISQQPYLYEYTQQEFRKALPPKDPFVNEFEPVPNYQKPTEHVPLSHHNYATPNNCANHPNHLNYPNLPNNRFVHSNHANLPNHYNYSNHASPPNHLSFPNHPNHPNHSDHACHSNHPNSSEGKLEAMYSNPNSFYMSQREYSHFANDKKLNTSSRNFVRVPEMSKVYSETGAPVKLEKSKTANMLSKSIDRNWKQNTVSSKYGNPDVYIRKQAREETRPVKQPIHDEVCAFDSREDNLTQYSRFNKPFLYKNFTEQANPAMDHDYFSETKVKGYDYTHPPARSPHGFLLSPEDLQSWVETFDEKIDDTPGDKTYTTKRSSVT